LGINYFFYRRFFLNSKENALFEFYCHFIILIFKRDMNWRETFFPKSDVKNFHEKSLFGVSSRKKNFRDFFLWKFSSKNLTLLFILFSRTQKKFFARQKNDDQMSNKNKEKICFSKELTFTIKEKISGHFYFFI